MFGTKQRLERMSNWVSAISKDTEETSGKMIKLKEEYDKLEEKHLKLIEYLKLREKYKFKTEYDARIGGYTNNVFVGYEPIKKCSKCKQEVK
jgi:hypothetical protein